MKRSDSELHSAVTEELLWLPSLDSSHIGVAVDGGAVILTGQVDSYPEKVSAGRAAQRVRGVTAVSLQITVRSSSAAATDADIAQEAGDALERAVNVPGSITAAVHGCVVTLSGDVKWHYQRQAALHSVHYLRGVTEIVDHIQIHQAVATTDIRTAIQAAILRNAQLEAKNIRVSTSPSGHVTIEGTVQSWAEHRQAAQIAWSAPGVTGITNNLHIDY